MNKKSTPPDKKERKRKEKKEKRIAPVSTAPTHTARHPAAPSFKSPARLTLRIKWGVMTELMTQMSPCPMPAC